ncbi:M48 family metalloprotease [Flavobacterium sp.]|uniref:M48 family metalloprotease n=1 Tax=Flavobacterium sp. TaxID=239 RepID=UPI0026098DF4|nr:M48 family metalloprotease [Flavobacterium sp.]
MRIGPFLCLVLSVFGFCQMAAQDLPIDTTDTGYRTELETLFLKRTAATKAVLSKIDNRQVRREVLESYTEHAGEFLELIKKGVFIRDKKYSGLLENILEKIKHANPDQHFDDMKLLIAASNNSNAYNIGNDFVVFNLPIIFDIVNEYELAFILSHEMAHQKLDHVLQSLVRSKEISNSDEVKSRTRAIARQKYNKGKLASELYKQIIYGSREESRKKEVQADSLGFIFFSRAYPEYKYQAIKTLEVLKNIDVPKDSLLLADYQRIFAKHQLTFKPEWIADGENHYSYQKDKSWNVDSLRTHPDCDQRIFFLKERFKIADSDVKDVSPATFQNLKKDSANEYIFAMYFIEEYGESLYNTLLSMKKNPDDVFLKKMLHDNLVKISIARNNFTANKYVRTEDPEYSDSYNQFLRFVGNLRKSELNQIIETFN